jgi:hypothetical protein
VTPTIGDLRFLQTIYRRLAAFPLDQLLETCYVSVRAGFGDLLPLCDTNYWRLAAFPSDHLSETCCVSVRPAFGDLLRFRQAIYRRLAAFPSDHLSKSCYVSIRLELRRHLVSVFPPLPLLSRSDHFYGSSLCSHQIRVSETCFVVICSISKTCLVCWRLTKRRSVDF